MSWGEFWYLVNKAVSDIIGIIDGDEDDDKDSQV